MPKVIKKTPSPVLRRSARQKSSFQSARLPKPTSPDVQLLELNKSKPSASTASASEAREQPYAHTEKDLRSVLQGHRKRKSSESHDLGSLRLTSENLGKIGSGLGLPQSSLGSMRITRSRAKASETCSIKSYESASRASTEAPSFTTDGTSSKGKVKAIPPSDPQFIKAARSRGILSIIESAKPSNFNEVLEILQQPRTSPTPDQTEFENFNWKIEVSHNEGGVQHAVISIVVKDYSDQPTYVQTFNAQFTRCPTRDTSKPQPDLIEGYTESTFDTFPVTELGSSAVPINGSHVPALAHFVGEFKRLGGDFRCGQNQAGYDAAYLVDGRDQATSYMDRGNKLDKAYVGSFVCDGERLQLFVHYSSTNHYGRIVFHQCPIFDFNLRSSYETFLQGRRSLRNLQDWTKGNAEEIKQSLIAYRRDQCQDRRNKNK